MCLPDLILAGLAIFSLVIVLTMAVVLVINTLTDRLMKVWSRVMWFVAGCWIVCLLWQFIRWPVCYYWFGVDL